MISVTLYFAALCVTVVITSSSKFGYLFSSLVTSLIKYLNALFFVRATYFNGTTALAKALFDYWLGYVVLLKSLHILLFGEYFVLLLISCLFF